MKTKIGMTVIGSVGIAALFVLVAISSCSKEDVIEPIINGITSGNDTIDNTSVGDWAIDKVHSNVMWETMYYGDNALLTGRFNNFDIQLYFDEATPTNSSIYAWVQLSTFNTGESGRDSTGKCGPKYMGVTYDTAWVDSVTYDLTPQSESDTAYFQSTSVESYGDGYLAKGNLTFRGITDEVSLYFTYIGQTVYEGTSGSTIRSGFSGEFKMSAITVFGVTSTSIADLVTVKVNFNVKKTI